VSLSPEALQQGLQYGPTAGMPRLCDWLLDLQEREHGRKRGVDWRVSITTGSQDGINKVSSVSDIIY
jgi:tryptophan aminotransferase